MKIEITNKVEFSKKLLIVDYLILMVLFLCTVFFPGIDFITLDVAWIAQVGISSMAYYWKAKTENRIKIPFKVMESLPGDMHEKIDLTEIITSIIQHE
jgi:hypothetical protein